MDLSGFYDWFMAQIQYVLLIVFIVLLLATAYKRAWIAMVGIIIGIAFIGAFIYEPTLLADISKWFVGMFTSE